MNSRNDPNWGLVSTFPTIGDGLASGAEAFLKEAYEDWYAQKHPKPTPAMVEWFNAHRPADCPRCGSARIWGHGVCESGVDRYECGHCHRTFTPVTGTVFDSFKIPPSEWMEYLLHLFEFHSVKTAARDNRNADSTGRYWLFKVFAVLRGWQDGIVLGNAAEIDEFSVRARGADARRDADGRLPRGMSGNRIVIATGIDLWNTDAFAVVAGPGKISAKRCVAAYSPHLRRNSWVAHDEEPAHNALFGKLSLYGEAWDSRFLKGLADEQNPLRPINEFHSYLRSFLESHSSFERALLQDWLNLFAFIWNRPADRRAKVALFMEMAMRKRALMRYRDVMGKKTADVFG